MKFLGFLVFYLFLVVLCLKSAYAQDQFFKVPDQKEQLEELKIKLSLTKIQLDTISKIITEMGFQAGQNHPDQGNNSNEGIKKMIGQKVYTEKRIREVLNDDQKRKYNEFLHEQQLKMRSQMRKSNSR